MEKTNSSRRGSLLAFVGLFRKTKPVKWILYSWHCFVKSAIVQGVWCVFFIFDWTAQRWKPALPALRGQSNVVMPSCAPASCFAVWGQALAAPVQSPFLKAGSWCTENALQEGSTPGKLLGVACRGCWAVEGKLKGPTSFPLYFLQVH